MPEIYSTIRLIACGVFKPALEFLRVEKKYPQLRLTFLPSKLHLYPQDLKKNLLREIASAHKRNEWPLSLYGKCFPGINKICTRNCGHKIPGLHCYEILLGNQKYAKIIKKTAGSYFVERELIINFKEYCLDPLELYDSELRKSFFRHYKKLIYVKQPPDPDLYVEADELAGFLNLSLEIIDADYSHLEKRLNHLIQTNVT